jgi:Putative Ig domain
MAAPIWKTPKGNLGTIQEQVFYELVMEVRVPDDPTPDLKFKIIAGALPPGIVMNELGVVMGRPKEVYRLRGVPFDVAQDTTSVFCCRAINNKTGQVADRTFSLTVTGNDAPTIVTPSSELAIVYDGTYAEIPVTAIDIDATDKIRYFISKGSLPGGLTLNSSTGVIEGFVEPNELLNIGATVGWSANSSWDEQPWDFGSRAVSKRFIFDVSVTDSKVTVSREFSIFVISKDSLTADNDLFNINGYYDVITADQDNKRLPVLLTPSSNIGTYAYDNYFAYKFEAKDFDGEEIEYSLLIGDNIGFDNEDYGFDATLLDFSDFILPPGLTLSTETGWLYGYIPSLIPIQTDYQFGIKVYKKNDPTYESKIVNYTITIVSDLRYAITWVSPTDLGTIPAGNISELAVEATNLFSSQLIYTIKVGPNSNLPQGLRLHTNGLIVGRPSFEVTTFDRNTLTLDKNVRELGALLPETTLDRKHTFTVRVNDTNNNIYAERTFTITVLPTYTEPYEALYLRSLPGLEDKEVYNQIVYNSDIIPDQFVYRSGDPYFGKQRNMDVLVMSGIRASTAAEYIQAMAINHYQKKLLLGQPEIAQALDDDGNVKYEVLYIPMRDDNGPTAKSIDLRHKIKRTIRIDSSEPNVDYGYLTLDGYDNIVYPNALTNMRSQIKESLGFVDREVLPRWMTSKQVDGKIPYWNPAMVLAYLKPGSGEQVKFLINRIFNYDLKNISFEVDRYVWDCSLSAVYDPSTDSYLDSKYTTFDADIRTGLDTLHYTFIGDGSSVDFDMTIQIETGIIDVYLEQYVATVDDSGLVLSRNLLVENIDYTRAGSILTLNEVPAENASIIVDYTNYLMLEVDYALTVPFNSVDGMTREYIDNLGGLDYVIDVYTGKRVIFATQEQYSGYIGEEDGWIRNKNMWDDGGPWDDPDLGFDNYEVIPGYNEHIADEDVVNQRAGIWEITVDDQDLLRFTFVQTVELNQKVLVKSGNFYSGKILRYGPTIRFEYGKTVPDYVVVSEQLKGNETTFDGNTTRFVNNISIYQEPDEGDKYLVFPRRNIFA